MRYLRAVHQVHRTWAGRGGTIVFAFLTVMLIGIMMSGLTHDRQLLLFASLCFLIAGLFVLVPIVSVVYFIMAFALLSGTFVASGAMTRTVEAL